LTDDEKDVEQEIKATDLDDQNITQLFRDLLYLEIIGFNKIKNLDNKQDYEFTSKIDGTALGREKELEIEIITENFHDHVVMNLYSVTNYGIQHEIIDANRMLYLWI
jgi:hypothetical protein